MEHKEKEFIEKIEKLDDELFSEFSNIIETDVNLTRQLVSFQANKTARFYRWYKYKEGFSNDLVYYYIRYNGFDKTKKIFDPFAGSGTTLFTARTVGIDSCGIELLPIGVEIIKTRQILLSDFNDNDFNTIKFYRDKMPWINNKNKKSFIEIKITEGAYPEETKKLIEQYLDLISKEKKNIQQVLNFVLLCVLEKISYTRKDGQYLRWDYRSGRQVGNIPFDKGNIDSFNNAIVNKLAEIIEDIFKSNEPTLFAELESKIRPGKIELITGSCLNSLATITNSKFDLVITSPPYANRYDYTRTYALELTILGVTATDLIKLRQTMLSCTVENKEKNLLDINKNWERVITILKEQKLLQQIIFFLEYKKNDKTLNNNGIPRMIKGYFYEMACVISELYRILNSNGAVVMVNDNVRYAGVSIAVDLILSKIAKCIGFKIEKISVLPNGKGNSSQQMGSHGRKLLRKCVYIWRKE